MIRADPRSMDIDAFLATDASSGRVAIAARVALLHGGDTAECPRYLAVLDRALTEEPPPFDTAAYADIYLNAAANWQWMAVSLITNAEREGDGAKRLWSLAACCDDDGARPLLKQHAVDESRHALLYLALLDLTFGGHIDPKFRRELNELSPKYSLRQELAPVEGSRYAKNPSIDDFIQMNIAEVRTAIHHIMQRPAMASYATAETQKRIVSIQNALLRDELKHVNYTAGLIERIAQRLTSEELSALFRRRFRDFNQITLDELGEAAFDCSVACCERHPTCRSKAPAHSGRSLELVQMAR
jgi:hypothetical protein